MNPRFAPVIPLEVACELSPSVLGDYHLLLAHDVLAHAKWYEDLYKNKGMDILMDNSLIELGYAMPLREVVEAANIVGAQYVILPDTLRDFDATMNQFHNAMNELDEIPWRNKRHLEFVPVIQGKSATEVIVMMDEVRTKCSTVAIPRCMVEDFGSRRFAAYMAAKRGLRIHLLGFSGPENLIDDIACARMPRVMGIDSAVPIRLALQDKGISLDKCLDAGPREDYWDDPFGTDDRVSVRHKVGRIEENLTAIRKWLHMQEDNSDI